MSCWSENNTYDAIFVGIPMDHCGGELKAIVIEVRRVSELRIDPEVRVGRRWEEDGSWQGRQLL
jgi:hypothetical protein